MGDHRHSHTLGGQVFHHFQNFAHHLWVQGRGRFVKEHHVRLHTQGPNDGHPLLLTAGKLSGVSLGSILQTHLGQQLHGHFLGFSWVHALDLDRGQRHVFHNALVRKEIEMLEHHTHFLAMLVQVDFFVGDIHALEDHSALCGPLQ